MILDRPCVFVDLETTGTSASSESITEIGLRFCEPDGSSRDWQQLVNPGRTIPGFIQRLTGISDAMVANAPFFEDIAAELLTMLDGYIMIAHNARFDYSFLKQAFALCGFAFKPELLCTVKLSRALYPSVQGHSLDAICARIGYRRERSHRALDDVIATHAFVDHALGEHGREALFSAALAQLRRPSQPPQLPDQEVSRIPNCPGVYRFYGENNALLYIGKSVRMRERVKSHFSADIHADREMRMAREVRHVDWLATAGELGALLRENGEIKSGSPIYNRRQRRHKKLWCFELADAEDGVLQPKLTAKPLNASDTAMPGRTLQRGRLHGLFTSKGAANKWFAAAIDEHRLCKKMLGLERGAGSCFNFQLKRCGGICAGSEAIATYNLRVQAAFAENQLQVWPFEGAAAIVEQADDWRDVECAQRDIHLVNHWVYLGTVHDLADIPARLAALAGASFDRETYRILNRFIHLAVPASDLLRTVEVNLDDAAETADANQL